jgi:hypothetical protein
MAYGCPPVETIFEKIGEVFNKFNSRIVMVISQAYNGVYGKYAKTEQRKFRRGESIR